MIPEGSIEFVHPNFLYLLIPAVLLLFLRRREGSRGSIAFGSLFILARLGRKPGGRIGLPSLILIVMGIIAGIFALARPQVVNQIDYTKSSGIDIMIAFDLSFSMIEQDMIINRRLADRVEVAQLVVDDFIKKRPNDRIGLIAFSGKPKMFSPLTLDHDLLREQVSRLNVNLMQARGTAIGSAIAASSSRLQERKDTKSKIIILITDGASNSGELTPMEAANLAHTLGIKIYTIAIGADNPRMGESASQFDEETLIAISKLTGGEHFRAKSTQMFVNAFSSIDRLEKSEASRHTIRKEKDLFPWLLGLCVLFSSLGCIVEIVRPRPAP